MISDKYAVSLICCTCLIGAGVFFIKYEAMELADKIKKAKAELVYHKKYRKILQAEWQALTNPERIQALADRHLGEGYVNADIIEVPIDGYCAARDEKKSEQLAELISEHK